MSKKAKTKNAGQRSKFIVKARELGCDENEAALEDRLRRIVPKRVGRKKKSQDK